jgi:di/tricarboxylate transporter
MILAIALTTQGWVTLVVVLVLLLALIRNVAAPDLLFVAAVTILCLFDVITPEEAFGGFANEGMLTVAMMFIIAAGLRETGVLDIMGHHVLGQTRSASLGMLRLAAVIVPLSAFLNNTPIVAMFVPIVLDWCRRSRIAPSRLLIPVSYLAILGGTCTLIGTSTNLVVNGMMIQQKLPEMSLFEISRVGVPYAIIGVGYLLFAGRFLLPDRKDLLEQLGESRREYLTEMVVLPRCRLIGQSVERAGLRQLPGLFLVEIDRQGQIITPVNPDEVIEEDDELVFTGVVSSIIELERIPGLEPVDESARNVSANEKRRGRMCEAVISQTSPLVGRTVRDADFRATYGAAIVAVHRSGSRIQKKIGDIELEPGDTLLMQTGPHFERAYRNDPAFYLVSSVSDYRAFRHDQGWIAAILLVAVIILMSTGIMSTLLAATLVSLLMVALGCLSTGEARRSIEWQTLIVIATAFGVGAALEKSGVAHWLAGSFVSLAGDSQPVVGLAIIYLLVALITEVITNNAAAVLMFPVCLEAAKMYDVSPRPFLIALMLAASASFMTPIGYQTNMMVYGPGGYKFSDFFRVGAPLGLLLWLVATLLIPLMWSF